MTAGILIQTENVQLFLLLKHILAAERFEVGICSHPRELLDAIHAETPAAVLLDCSNRNGDLPDVCRRIKAARGGNIAIAAFANAPNADHGLTRVAGIDAVICSPFDPAVLLDFLTRLRASMPSRLDITPETVLRYADVVMNVAGVRVTRNGHVVDLTALQFRLLLHLMRQPAMVHSREDLIAAGWPPEAEVEPRTVDIHIGHVRRALNRHGADIIRTVRSVGYSLDERVHWLD
ncbi:response regulator transcription factor [Sinorhizobium mexicanum]|uniref:Response regulator transcription factor n=1 Tax=Sinorhizobium mexicanum TaxID=375549 RepID=A0A859QSE4_9HYPH|nr:response regulator transcription factor [Sinorhizobium mexicanum]MBP1884738.1 two-component system phosphate regulon response regulator PhoB [Sinorhizobium mexicanum]QLL65620.1 response regulator transcription factor [Sinorhizobium mexicanum]